VLSLAPDHVSAYALTVEPATPLGRAVADGTRPAPDDDDQADKYALADERLRSAGFEWYEVSNWSRPGQECRHNLLYWRQDDYVAIGCAAHGHTDGRRWWNVRTPERYVERVTSGRSPEAGAEALDPDHRDEETFLLALRTRDGARCAPGAATEVDALVALGLVTRDGDRVVLTRPGRLVANEVTVRLLAAGGSRPEGAGTR